MAPKFEQYSALSKQLVGLTIDGGVLLLASIITVGSYGVIFRGDVRQGSLSRTSYAVKCIIMENGEDESCIYSEARLHAQSTEHNNVVHLRRVIKEDNLVFLVMDHYDADLFTMITDKQFYLGRTEMIRDAFLQIVGAVEHCHSVGVYHRDIKPENILFRADPSGNRPRLALADFGLATESELCWETGVGSIYYMSPECSGDVTPGAVIHRPRATPYSARAHDVWSLGIVLVNLACGRNPWKRAHHEDATFANYIRNPHFLVSILPLSFELSKLLSRVFTLRWEDRISLEELKEEVMRIPKFSMSSMELQCAPQMVKIAAGQALYDRVIVEERVEQALALCQRVQRAGWVSKDTGVSDVGSRFSFDSGSDFGKSDFEDELEDDPHLISTVEYLSGQIQSQYPTHSSYIAEKSILKADALSSNNHFLFVNRASFMDPDSPATSSSYESDSPRTPVTSITPRTPQYFDMPSVVSSSVFSSSAFQTSPEIIIDEPLPRMPREKNSFLSLVNQIRLPGRNSHSNLKHESLSAASVTKPNHRPRRSSASMAFKLLSHLRA